MFVKLAGRRFLRVTQGVMKNLILASLLKSAPRACLVNLFGYSRTISLGDQAMRQELGGVGGQPWPGVRPEHHLGHRLWAPGGASVEASLCQFAGWWTWQVCVELPVLQVRHEAVGSRGKWGNLLPAHRPRVAGGDRPGADGEYILEMVSTQGLPWWSAASSAPPTQGSTGSIPDWGTKIPYAVRPRWW